MAFWAWNWGRSATANRNHGYWWHNQLNNRHTNFKPSFVAKIFGKKLKWYYIKS